MRSLSAYSVGRRLAENFCKERGFLVSPLRVVITEILEDIHCGVPILTGNSGPKFRGPLVKTGAVLKGHGGDYGLDFDGQGIKLYRASGNRAVVAGDKGLNFPSLYGPVEGFGFLLGNCQRVGLKIRDRLGFDLPGVRCEFALERVRNVERFDLRFGHLSEVNAGSHGHAAFAFFGLGNVSGQALTAFEISNELPVNCHIDNTLLIV